MTLLKSAVLTYTKSYVEFVCISMGTKIKLALNGKEVKEYVSSEWEIIIHIVWSMVLTLGPLICTK